MLRPDGSMESHSLDTCPSFNESVFNRYVEWDFSRDLWCLLGLPFDALDLASAENRLISLANSLQHSAMATPNVNFVCRAWNNPGFRDSVINSELSVLDGMPLLWIARLLQVPIPERVAGSTLILDLVNRDYSRPLSVFVFGGAPGVAKSACDKISISNGTLECIGHLFPGFGSMADMSAEFMIQEINIRKPDLLLVALGAERGQFWIERNRFRINAGTISHVGATVDFLAGNVKRAPAWVQAMGFEWLYRITQQPSLLIRYVRDAGCLLRILFSRVLPHWAWLKFGAKAVPDVSFTAFVCSTEHCQTVILSGAAVAGGLQRLRSVFRDAVSGRGDVRVDLSDVSDIDGAGIALFLLLKKHLSRQRRKCRFVNAPRKICWLFYFNMAEHLLE